MQRKTETLIYSTGGVVVVFLILVLVNFLASQLRTRVDLTQGHLFTLSAGTHAVLDKLEAPVKLRFYYTQGSDDVPVDTKAYARRVEDLLAEYQQASHGKVVIEKLDPQPDSDAEDSATLDGIDAQSAGTGGDKFYLGLAVSFLDQKLAIPVLAADRERLLEYDITRAIARATVKDRPVIGVMSSLPVMGGGQLNPMTQQLPTPPWVFINELQRDFTLKKVDEVTDYIDPAIKVLLVIHPREISDDGQFAIDQFLLRGGKVIAFVDPFAYFDQQGGQMGMGQNKSSNLDKLIKAWGLTYDPGKVVLDMKYSTGEGDKKWPTLLTLTAEALNKDDVATNGLTTMMLPFPGAIGGTPAAGLTQSVLIKSSPLNQMVDSIIAQTQGEPATRGFVPSNKELNLAVKLTGKFKTAFPAGRPDEGQKPGMTKDGKPAPEVLKEAKADGAVVLVADADLIADGAAVQQQEIYGQRVVVPINGNLAFAQALVEQMAGDANLINLRSRADASRPFIVVRELEAKAQQQYFGKLKELQDSLTETQDKLKAMQKGGADGKAAAVVTPEQQKEVDNFRRKATETKLQLKDMRKKLRADSDALQVWTKVVNIALVPLLVALAGIFWAFYRKRRTAGV
ncbi:MAG TPA: GldG family protein [Burkholderiales bacterium]|nr:GldG family protein [Burkholderiales bacterium]